MKSIRFIVAVLAVCSLNQTFAERNENAMGLSLKAGMTFADVTTPADISSSTRTGFLAGAGLEFRFTDFLSLQPEALYSQRGVYLVDGNKVNVTVNSHAVEVPVLLKVGFGEKVRPYIVAGPSFIFNLSNDFQGSVGGAQATIGYDPKTLDFAGVLGGGVELGNFFVGLRYNVGIVSVDDNSAEWRSRGIQALAGVNI